MRFIIEKCLDAWDVIDRHDGTVVARVESCEAAEALADKFQKAAA